MHNIITDNTNELLRFFAAGRELDSEFAAKFVDMLHDKDTTEFEMAILTAAWKYKGYTPAELARVITHIRSTYLTEIVQGHVADCCGIGGDSQGSFNISTTCAFVAASMGITIAKHGGRRTTSQSGSIDFLEALGVSTYCDSGDIATHLRQHLVFISSPVMHQLLGRWKAVCQKLEFFGQTGIFGTLTNPVKLTHQLLGVPKFEMGELMSETMHILGRQRAMVIFGEPKLDEASISGITHIWELDSTQTPAIRYYTIHPRDLGIPLHSMDSIAGGTPAQNVKIFRDFLAGRAPEGLYWSIVLNTALLVSLVNDTPLESAVQTVHAHLQTDELRKFYDSYVGTQKVI